MNGALTKKRRSGLAKYEYILWILPMFVLMAVFSYYPPIVAVIKSFTDWNGQVSNPVGFENYINLFQDPIFWTGMKNVVIIIVCGIVLGNVATLLLAELLYNMKSSKACAFFRFMFVLPMLVPGMVSMLLWTKVIFNGTADGFMNTVLAALNITNNGKPFGFYYDENMALMSLILTGFPFVAGTSFLIYLAGLQNIDNGIVEAARLDGITTAKRIWYIDLPMLLSQIKYFVILGVIGGFQGFSIQLMITKGGPYYSTMVPGYYIYYQAFEGGSKFGYACAAGVFLFIITLIITILNNKFLKNNEQEY